jgi:uncharacterized membrane protein
MWDVGDRVFRARLERELAAWRAEGLIDDDTARRIAARHALDHQDEGRGMAMLAVYLLGVLLIGGGVLSLVAWNWAALPAAAKLLLIGSAMAAAHVYGWRMWQVDGARPKLGHALTVLGTLIFGADIGLVAQVFHISGAWYSGFVAWAAGAWAAALAYGSVAHAVVALGTLFVAWWGYLDVAQAWLPLFAWVFPLAFLPLALRHRSRLLFGLAVVAFGIALPVAAGDASDEAGPTVLALLAVAGALLAWHRAFPLGDPRHRYADVATNLGVLAVVGFAYAFAFHDAADELATEHWKGPPLVWVSAALPLALLAAGLLRRGEGTWHRGAPVGTVALYAAPVLLVAAIPGGIPLTIVANAVLVVVSGVAIATAVESLDRGPFWMGSVLAGAVVVSRFLEFDTDLWLKALAFIGAGVALLTFGVAFERRLQAQRRQADVA